MADLNKVMFQVLTDSLPAGTSIARKYQNVGKLKNPKKGNQFCSYFVSNEESDGQDSITSVSATKTEYQGDRFFECLVELEGHGSNITLQGMQNYLRSQLSREFCNSVGVSYLGTSIQLQNLPAEYGGEYFERSIIKLRMLYTARYEEVLGIIETASADITYSL